MNESGNIDTENGKLSHVASNLEELIIVDSTAKRNKKEMTESRTQTEEFEYMYSVRAQKTLNLIVKT